MSLAHGNIEELTLTSDSDRAEKTWVWKTEESELWFDEGTVVNLRIEAEKWQDQAPQGPTADSEAEKEIERHLPYSIEVLNFSLFKRQD